MQIFPKKILVSYDVTSLFTNTPLEETIDIAINPIFNQNPNLNITKKKLKKLFLFATLQTYFIFNSTFYNEADGVAIGFHLYKSTIRPFMAYCCHVWAGAPSRYLDLLDKLQE